MRSNDSNIPGAMRGFTLMELMLTIAIVAMILGFGVPSFRTMMSNNRLTTQTNDFIAALNYARSEAISRNVGVTVCRADAVTDTDCAPDDDPWEAWIVRDNAGTVLRNGEINQTLVVNSDLVNQSVTYAADGLATSGGAPVSDLEITVCIDRAANGNRRVITLGAGSRLTTQKSTGTCP